jgi:hypothetical protein
MIVHYICFKVHYKTNNKQKKSYKIMKYQYILEMISLNCWVKRKGLLIDGDIFHFISGY